MNIAQLSIYSGLFGFLSVDSVLSPLCSFSLPSFSSLSSAGLGRQVQECGLVYGKKPILVPFSSLCLKPRLMQTRYKEEHSF